MYRSLLDSVGEGKGGKIWENGIEIRCMIQDAWGWCTGMTQRDGMGREVGGVRMGNMCTHMADSC